MYRPSRLNNRSSDDRRPGRSRWLRPSLVILPLTTLVISLVGCQALKTIDQLRTDFVALRYVKNAQQAATEPIDRQKATHYADRAVALASDNATVLDRSGRVYLYVGAFEQAIAVLQKASLMTGQGYYYELGTCYLNSGQEDRGREYLAKHLQGVQFDHMTRRLSELVYAGKLNNIGYVYAEANVELDLALDLTKQAVTRDPLNAAFVDSLGWVYYRRGDLNNAAFYLERAVRQSLQQPNAELHYHLGVVYARAGRSDDAGSQLRQALRIRPNYPEAARELRRLHWELAPPWHARVSDLRLS